LVKHYNAWNQLQAVEISSLDWVWRVSQMDDILLPVDEISEEEKAELILMELERAMDCRPRSQMSTAKSPRRKRVAHANPRR
jgi:hypothetical protein